MSDYHTALVWQLSPRERGHNLTPLQRGILAKFAAWYNPDDPTKTIHSSQDYLAWLFEVARETVNRSIAGLVEIGYIQKTRVGKGANNRYLLNIECMEQDARPKWGDVTNRHIQKCGNVTSRSDESSHPIEDEAVRRSVKTKEEGGASLATRPRDQLWDMFISIHGDPASKSERGKFNAIVKQLRDAEVSPDEYPSLVAAYVRKHQGLQPAAATIANRVGELRHYRDRGPVTVPDETEARNQEAMRKALNE